MRTFIAITLPQEVKSRLTNLQDKLKLAQADISWVTEKNIHLTLKFLGEINDNKIPEIIEKIGESTKGLASFTAGINSVGAFPKISLPRVIWAGIGGGDKQITEIARKLEENLIQIGFLAEVRPFSSHITIGRVKGPKNKDKLASILSNCVDYFGKEKICFGVDKLTLYKSTLTPKGAIYEALKEVAFKKI